MSKIELKEIGKVYRMGDNSFEALKGASFSFSQGDMLTVIGPSGSGKSTMMNIIGLLDQPTSGVYYINGKPVAKFEAGLTMKINVSLDSIQAIIDKHKK